MSRTVNLDPPYSVKLLSAFMLAVALPLAAAAQAPRATGPAADAQLKERARKEDIVVLYTSLAPTESRPLSRAFEKKYGIKVELWRALSDKVVQRVLTESQAKRYSVDVVETNGPEMEMLAREHVLGELHSAYAAD